MATKKKARKSPRKRKAARKSSRKRRGVRGLGDYDTANAQLQARMTGSECERENNQRVAMGLKPRSCADTLSPGKVNASETRAEDKGCKAPKGRKCVSVDVAKIGKGKKTLRAGCRRSPVKGTYYCTESALRMHAAGKERGKAHRAGKGVHKASWKSAVNKLTGQFKPGCAYSFKLRSPICKTRKSK